MSNGVTAMITASMASVRWRSPALAEVVRVILPQVDRLNVFLQDYDEQPTFLDDPKISVVHARTQPEWHLLGSSAKFFWFCDGRVADGYHLTIDDDIEYPPDYVDYCVRKIEEYARQAVVGFHGVTYHPVVRDGLHDRVCRLFHAQLRDDESVHLIGTGTLAHHTSTFRLSREDFRTPNMADIWAGIALQRQGVPSVCVRRPNLYLRSMDCGSDPRSISLGENEHLRKAEAINSHRWRMFDLPRRSSSIVRPVVTVIPAYNEQPSAIQRAVDNARSVSDWVVVVDDGSDHPIAVEGADVIRRHNGGPGAALNTGIRSLPDDAVVCRLDVGDEFYPDAKRRQIDLVRSGRARASASPSLDPVRNRERPFNKRWARDLYKVCQFAGPTVVFERSAWKEVGGFDESLRWAQDWHFLILLHHAQMLAPVQEMTCSAGEYPGGHSDVSGDDRDLRSACVRAVRQLGMALADPGRHAHLFNERWARKRGREPLRLNGIGPCK